MATSAQALLDWNRFFQLVGNRVRSKAQAHWKLESDGSGSDLFLSIHRLVNSFPFEADIVLLDTHGIDSPFKEGKLGAAIRYDMAQPNSSTFRFHGTVLASDLASNAGLLASVLGLDTDGIKSVGELRLRFISDCDRPLHVVPYDPRLKPEEYADDLLEHLVPPFGLADQFSARVDFNEKYSLLADPVMAEEDVLKVAEINAGFFPQLRSEALLRVQKDVRSAQLLRHVPEDVRRVFDVAKRLYVFGLFEYQFFTVSCHYSYLAIESAIYHRWNAALVRPTVLQHGPDAITLPQTCRGSILTYCRHKKWKPQDVLVNGRRLPATVSTALDQLRQDGIITDWQRKRLKQAMNLRNIFSHLEFASITGPDVGDLTRAAESINMLFDSVKP